MTCSDWTWAITTLTYADETVDVITIFDRDLGNMSVTNDVENVLEAIAKELSKPLSEYPITYFDSTDSEDEIIIGQNNKFLSFAALTRGRTSRFVKTEAAGRWRLRQRAAS
jgi:hypothetical protein